MTCPFGQGESPCKESACPLWDAENGRCSIVSIREYLKHNNELLEQNNQLLRQIDSRLVTEDMGAIVDIEKNSNKHLKSIDYHTRCSCVVHNAALVLVNEFLANKDFDGNGKVYGRDFKISNAPPMLKSLEDNPYWQDPQQSMTMDEYLRSLPDDSVMDWIEQEYQTLS